MNITPFSFFDKIFCINMDHRVDRWNNCKIIFEKLQIQDKVIRFSGYNFIEEYQKNNRFAEYFTNGVADSVDLWNLRRAGCAMSFIQIILNAKQNNYKNVLIFEDDINLCTDTDTALTYINNSIEQLPENWELFYLSANPTTANGCSTPISLYSENLCKVHGAFCCHSIAVNNTVYDQVETSLLSYKDIFDWILQKVNFDTFCLNEVQPRQNSYMCRKKIFSQCNNFSDVENCLRHNDDVINQTYHTYSNILLP